MNITSFSDTLRVLASWYNKAFKFGQITGENSLSDLTRETRVEPLVIVSKDCIGIEAMNDIMQGILTNVIVGYSQAVELYGRIDDIKVRETLQRLNPNRDASAGALLASVSMESYKPAALKFSMPVSSVPTMEALKDVAPQGKGSNLGTKELQDESRNMSVGKVVNVKFIPTGSQTSVTLPIQFRLLVSYINSPSVVNIIANNTDDTGFWARFERARDGGISPFLDFLMAKDLIAEKRKVMYSNDGRVLQKILNRASANKRAAWATQNPSLNTLANIFVITEQELMALEAKFGRKIDNEGMREAIFRNVYASTLVVVDRRWNQVTFWERGTDTGMTLDFKQLKTQNGSKGTDLMDALRQFNLGAPIA